MSTQERSDLRITPGEGAPGTRAAADGQRHRPNPSDERLANTLGWVSLGLGLAGLAAPGSVARMIGLRDDDKTRETLRLVGARELVSGFGILSQRRPTGWVWSRVAGDALDLALLGSQLTSDDADKDRVAVAAAAVAGITALDLFCSQQLSRSTGPQGQQASGFFRAQAITVWRPLEEVYAYWSSLENLPNFMTHLRSVERLDDRRSRWVAEGPAGRLVEWEAETLQEVPNECLTWRSLPGSQVHHSGRVDFRRTTRGEGTEIRVQMEVVPPGGKLGEMAAYVFGKDPGQQLHEDLRHFKQVMEVGEIVRSEGSLGGNQFPQHPAQPPASLQKAA